MYGSKHTVCFNCLIHISTFKNRLSIFNMVGNLHTWLFIKKRATISVPINMPGVLKIQSIMKMPKAEAIDFALNSLLYKVEAAVVNEMGKLKFSVSTKT